MPEEIIPIECYQLDPEVLALIEWLDDEMRKVF